MTKVGSFRRRPKVDRGTRQRTERSEPPWPTLDEVQQVDKIGLALVRRSLHLESVNVKA